MNLDTNLKKLKFGRHTTGDGGFMDVWSTEQERRNNPSVCPVFFVPGFAVKPYSRTEVQNLTGKLRNGMPYDEFRAELGQTNYLGNFPSDLAAEIDMPVCVLWQRAETRGLFPHYRTDDDSKMADLIHQTAKTVLGTVNTRLFLLSHSKGALAHAIALNKERDLTGILPGAMVSPMIDGESGLDYFGRFKGVIHGIYSAVGCLPVPAFNIQAFTGVNDLPNGPKRNSAQRSKAMLDARSARTILDAKLDEKLHWIKPDYEPEVLVTMGDRSICPEKQKLVARMLGKAPIEIRGAPHGLFTYEQYSRNLIREVVGIMKEQLEISRAQNKC